jgi:hypothetical protein
LHSITFNPGPLQQLHHCCRVFLIALQWWRESLDLQVRGDEIIKPLRQWLLHWWLAHQRASAKNRPDYVKRAEAGIDT